MRSSNSNNNNNNNSSNWPCNNRRRNSVLLVILCNNRPSTVTNLQTWYAIILSILIEGTVKLRLVDSEAKPNLLSASIL